MFKLEQALLGAGMGGGKGGLQKEGEKERGREVSVFVPKQRRRPINVFIKPGE